MSKRKIQNQALSHVLTSKDDPYTVIEDFFTAASLEHYRKYISSMLKAAYSDGYWKKSDPGSLLFFQDQMERLIISSRSFIKTGKNSHIKDKRAKLKVSAFDEALDPLSYYGWHRNNALWEFFPRHLSKKEFINPFLVFEQFFAFKSVREWCRDLKQLISYALSPFENETALEFDFLRINSYLQKLIEASHLIEVRVNRPKRGIDQKIPGTDKTPVESEFNRQRNDEPENYSGDPYDIINRFFLDGTIEDGRDDLTRLFEAAYPDGLISREHYPSLLIYIFERLEQLIDAAYAINQEWTENTNIAEAECNVQVIPRVKELYKKIKNWNLFPCRLKPIEWIYPRLAIRTFFEHQSLSHWKRKLHELLQAGVNEKSICNILSDPGKLYSDCCNLERLVEAMWVIKLSEH